MGLCPWTKEKEMRYLKLGAALAAAAALMALAVAAPASATVFCKVASAGSCGAGNVYPVGTELKGELESGSVFKVEEGTKLMAECRKSPITAKVSNAGGSGIAVVTQVEAVAFSECREEAVLVDLRGSLEVSSISGTNNGTVVWKGAEFTMGYLGAHCAYVPSTALGADAGKIIASPLSTSHAVFDMTMKVTRVEGVFPCPSEASFTAQYTLTLPKPLYVTAS
jgi:hypothetical protein